MFEYATKNSLRYNTTRGILTSEDLYDLSLTDLDNIAQEVSGKIKEDSKVKSFITKKRSATKADKVRLDILKHVINEKLDEAEAVEQSKANRAVKDELLDILDERKHDDRKQMSTKDIEKMIKKL